MRHQAMRAVFALTLTGTVLLLTGACTPVQPPAPSRARAAEAGVLTGTCHDVDTEKRTVTVVTGVGFALRIVRLSVDPACEITVRGAIARLEDLRPGEVVRIRYASRPGGNIAVSLETVTIETAGVTR